MAKVRIIPRLDIKGSNVVKPVQTEALRVIGDPKKLAFQYYKEGADEIIYMDIVASLYGRNIDYDLLKLVTEDIFVPVTIGGGMRSIHDINNAMRAGADKIAINTYAISHPNFLKEAVQTFGAQCIVLAVDAKMREGGKWEAYTDGGREKTGKDLVTWIKRGIELGVGEVLVGSIDRDGTRDGYEVDLIRQISSFSPVPVVAHGGAGSLGSIYEIIADGGADAVSASSVFHYNELSIKQVKKYLKSKKISVRLT